MPEATSPADQISTLLPVDPDWTVKIGQMVDQPHRQICFFDTGGLSPNPKWKLDYVTVMVHVRGEPNDYSVGWQKARQVRDFYLGITPQDLLSGDRIDGIICQGDMGFLTYDDKKRPLFSVNFQLFWEPGDTNTTSREPL